MRYQVLYSKELVQDLKVITGLDPFEELWKMICEELRPQYEKFWDEQLLALEGSRYVERPETDEFSVEIGWHPTK